MDHDPLPSSRRNLKSFGVVMLGGFEEEGEGAEAYGAGELSAAGDVNGAVAAEQSTAWFRDSSFLKSTYAHAGGAAMVGLDVVDGSGNNLR